MLFVKNFFLITFVSLSLFVKAQQTTTISGTIKDNQGPLVQVSVILKEISKGTVTNANGKFVLKNIKAGNYTLVISSIGYLTIQKNISVKSDDNLQLDFLMQVNTTEMQAVNVIGKTKTQEIRESGFAVSAIETKKFANTTADLNQVLNRSTGVRIREQGGMGSSFNFSINGLSGKQVRFFLDGIPMDSFGEGMSLNNIPINLAERIEVYKGVVPIELGSDALGGAVNVITDQNTKKFLDASFSYGSFNTSRAALSGRLTDDKTGLAFNFSGFHNYSDNNYIMHNNPKNDAEIKIVENNEFIYRDVRRFHDAYRSSMGQIDVGLNNKSWADKISLGLTYSNLYNELQTGASQNNVYGAAYQEGNFYMTSLKYKKNDFIAKGLTANIAANLSSDRPNVIDTSSYVYGWGGIVRPETIAGELRDIKTITHWKNLGVITRTNFTYKINEKQNLNLNYTLNHLARFAKEDVLMVDNNPFDKPNHITKNVIGLAYQNDLFNNKLSNTIFVKYFGLSTFVRQAVFLAPSTPYLRKDSTTNKNYFGYGLASRYKIVENIGIKFSFEHAYRLQEAQELFGNGIDIASNINLKPEESSNINLGAYYTYYSGDKHKFSLEGSFFYRNVENLIFSSPAGKYSSYVNVGKAQITGFEGEFCYKYNNLLDFTLNANYQNAINNRKINPLTGMKDPVYGDRIPNQPWFFGNAILGIGRDNLIGKNTRLQLNYSASYIQWFYISWESLGSNESRNKIPTQLIHSTSLSYSLKNGKYNISLESFNLTNELAYDNFRLQKPGRSVFLKLRYFIK